MCNTSNRSLNERRYKLCSDEMYSMFCFFFNKNGVILHYQEYYDDVDDVEHGH